MLDMGKYQQERMRLDAIDAEDMRFQSRAGLDEKVVLSLMESIKEHGQNTPLDLVDFGIGCKPPILNGHHRYEAMKRNGQETCLVRRIPISDFKDPEKDPLKKAIENNILQNSLKELDLMLNCWKLYKFGDNISDISRQLKTDRKTVRWYILIQEAGPEVQDAVKQGKMSVKNTATFLAKTDNNPGVPDEGGEIPHPPAGDDEKLQINVENRDKLVEILKRPDCKAELKKLFSAPVPNYRTISDVPGFVDRFKKALSKRKDFTPSEGQTPGERQSEGPTQPAGTGSSECTGTSANAGRVRETSRGQELSLDIDIRKDTQASLLEKARFLIDNGRALEALAKQMSKKTKENGRWKKEKVKPEPATFATNRAGHAGAELPAINRVDSVAGGSVVQSASPVTPNGATPSQDELNRKMLEKQTLLTEKQNLEQMKNMIESGDNAPLVIELLKAQGMTPEQLKTRLVEIDKKLKELGG